MRRMERISGRSDDMLIVRGVNLYPSQFEDLILGDERLSPHYILEVSREDRLDRLEVHAEIRSDSGSAARDSIARDIARQIKSSMGVSAAVHVSKPGTIERSMGKARRVIDRRAGT